MYRSILFGIFILLTGITSAQSRVVVNEPFLIERLANTLALDEIYGCMYQAINAKKVKFTYHPLKKWGFYFDNIDFYAMSIDSSDYDKCPETVLPYYNHYIVAVVYGNKIFRLKGFNDNDFNSFYLELQQIAGAGSKVTIKDLINDYYVDGLDFECLYKATKEKAKFNPPQNIGKINYKYRDCLRPCKSMIIVQ